MIRTRLERLKDKETRKLIAIFLGGKMLGVVALLGAMKGLSWFLPTVAGAQTIKEVSETVDNTVNGINTMWVLVTAFLVFFMQAGFMGLEIGFARSKETVNILMECVFDTCLCGILYWAFGFAFQFGAGNAIIGHSNFFLRGIPDTYDYAGSFDTGVAFLAFFLFQFAFADTASTITSGAMVGRTSFKGDIMYSTCVSGFFYPIFGHWVWGPGGWLQTLDSGMFSGIVKDGLFFRDFAGSTVVHTVGGVIALTGAIVLGPRLGRKFKRDGGGPTPPSDLTWGAIGAVILWFGWYGFNPGSTLSAMDFVGIGRVAANTTLAACAGGLVAVFWVYPKTKKWDLGISVNGLLGGLVAVTAPCYWVNPFGAVCIGVAAGIIVPLATEFMEWRRIDDPIGAVAVHLFCGVFGTLSIGLFATGEFADFKGLFYGGGGSQLLVQAIGSLSCIIVVGGLSFLVFKFIRSLPGSWNLRLEEDLELEGIDITEHGTPAYHVEFGQGMTYSTPSGLPPRTPVTTSTSSGS
ncbi:MAG: ammonium transporter, Amt family [Actinomycetota bacterium]|jgi:Amt family ammonium transporter